jgi:hypothetical protein
MPTTASVIAVISMISGTRNQKIAVHGTFPCGRAVPATTNGRLCYLAILALAVLVNA